MKACFPSRHRALLPGGSEAESISPGPVDAATLREIIHAMDTYAVCVFRGTALSDESHIAFSYLLGKLEYAPSFFGKGVKRFNYPELFDAGNLDANGNILMDERRRLYNKGNALWHTDSSFNPHRSAYSLAARPRSAARGRRHRVCGHARGLRRVCRRR